MASNKENIALNFMIKKKICEMYNISIDNETKRLFDSYYDRKQDEYVQDLVTKIMSKIPRKKPRKYIPSISGNEAVDFYLSYNKTLSIKKCKSGYAPPRFVGQAGIKEINYYFEGIFGKKVEKIEEVKRMYSDKDVLSKIIPIFVEKLLVSDYNVFILNEDDIRVYPKITYQIKLEKEKISISLSGKYPHISYDNISIIEIAYVRATPIIRINVRNIDKFLKKVKMENVTVVRGKLGDATEKAICNLFDLKNNINVSDYTLVERISPYIFNVLNNNNIIPSEYMGRVKGEEKLKQILKDYNIMDKHLLECIDGFGVSLQSPIDFFVCKTGTMSVKTVKNKNYLVCPDTIGQPSVATCTKFIKKIFPESNIEINPKSFLDIIMNKKKLKVLVGEYVKYLFSCEYLFYLCDDAGITTYCKIFSRKEEGTRAFKYEWKEELFEYCKDKDKLTYDLFESKTANGHGTLQIDYCGIRLGQFDIHKHHGTYIYQFRFNLNNFIDIISKN